MATTATTAQREIPFAILNRGDSDQTFSNQNFSGTPYPRNKSKGSFGFYRSRAILKYFYFYS